MVTTGFRAALRYHAQMNVIRPTAEAVMKVTPAQPKVL